MNMVSLPASEMRKVSVSRKPRDAKVSLYLAVVMISEARKFGRSVLGRIEVEVVER